MSRSSGPWFNRKVMTIEALLHDVEVMADHYTVSTGNTARSGIEQDTDALAGAMEAVGTLGDARMRIHAQLDRLAQALETCQRLVDLAPLAVEAQGQQVTILLPGLVLQKPAICQAAELALDIAASPGDGVYC